MSMARMQAFEEKRAWPKLPGQVKLSKGSSIDSWCLALFSECSSIFRYKWGRVYECMNKISIRFYGLAAQVPWKPKGIGQGRASLAIAPRSMAEL